MANGADAVVFLLQLVVFLLLPLGLMLILFLMARKYRGMFEAVGFTRKEMGLLITGSLTALIVPAELPLLVYRNYFLAVNLGGAIIPTVLSIHLLRAKRVPWRAWVPGTLVVSMVSYLITRVQPEAGIVAEFPYYFLPALTAAALALILFSRSGSQAPAFAYATATLGSLVGADAFHLPELFQARQFVGSIGGAGVFDLVYIGGIMSFALVLLFASRRLRRLRAQVPHAEVARVRVVTELRDAHQALMQGAYQLSAQRSLGAIQAHIDHLQPESRGRLPYVDRLAQLNPDPGLRQAYEGIVWSANLASVDFPWARWALVQSEALLRVLLAAERQRYAGLGRRVVAFGVDASLMFGLVAGLALVLFSSAQGVTRPGLLTLAVFFWAFLIQVVYFSAFEYFWKGRTPGKWLMRIHVEEAFQRPLDFITVFTRNTVRLLDLALLYVAALFMIGNGARRQRIGDRVAETVVVRDAAGRSYKYDAPLSTV